MHQRMVLAKCIFVSCFIFYSTLSFAAAEAIGQVVWVKGNVQANQPNGNPRQLQRKSQIFLKDIIKTDEAGTGQIILADSTIIALRDNTEMHIDEFVVNAKVPKDEKAVINLIKGGFRTITGTISKDNPEGYQVKTPVATIGVRGTDYTLFYDMVKGLMAKLDLGAISIKNDAGELELNKDMAKIYSMIQTRNTMPKILTNMPNVFLGQPTVTPVSRSQMDSTTGGGGGAISGPVSSFCIG